MSEKVTINFGSFADGGENQDILFQGPVKIFASVDTPSDLYVLQDVPEDENIFVYVRNVVNSQDRTKSAYYMHDCEDGTWSEVLLGTHSHANKEILDQLGEIDIEDLEYNANKILTLTKVDVDGSQEDYAWQYKLDWRDYPSQLPPIPTNLLNKPVYLTYENGEYIWKDKLIPAQTFQYKQVKVTTAGSRKTLIVNDLVFDKDYDEVLVFDQGDLIPSPTLTQKEDGSWEVTIPSDDPHTFDRGETINLLIIKSGTVGFMNSIAEEYMTKQDAVKLLSAGTLSLHEYATKIDLANKSDIHHTHGQYALKGHDHDERYAMAKHLHGEYLAKADVYGIISSCLSELLGQEDPEITQDDINDIFGEAITNLRSEIIELITPKADRSYIESVRTDLITNYLNAANVKIQSGSQVISLEAYLNILENRISAISGKASDIQLSAPIKVQIPEGRNIGIYKNDDVIETGTTIQTLLTNMLREEIAPTLVQPSLDIETTMPNAYIEVGEKISIKFKVKYQKNDAGNLTKAHLYINDVETELDDDLEALVEIEFLDDNPINIKATAVYSDGAKHSDNLGQDKYYVHGGTIEKTISLKAERRMFLGYYAGTDIRTAESFPFQTGHTRVEAKWYANIQDFVIAIPKTTQIFVKSAFYINQGCEMLDLFTKTTEEIPGARSKAPILYEVYKFHMASVPTDTLYFDIYIERSNT